MGANLRVSQNLNTTILCIDITQSRNFEKVSIYIR